jgi:para-nitrobenzyl esterase
MWKRPWRDIDFALEKTMNDYWVNFVKDGNPNGKNLPEWIKYDKSSQNIMVIGDEVRSVSGLHKDEFEFLNSNSKK